MTIYKWRRYLNDGLGSIVQCSEIKGNVRQAVNPPLFPEANHGK